MWDDILEAIIEGLMEGVVGDVLDEKCRKIKEKWKKWREQRAARKKL